MEVPIRTKEDLKLRVSVKVDDEVVSEMSDADSIVGNYSRLMFVRSGGRKSLEFNEISYEDPYRIANLSVGTNGRIRVNFPPYNQTYLGEDNYRANISRHYYGDNSARDKLIIAGIKGVSGINKEWYISNTYYTTSTGQNPWVELTDSEGLDISGYEADTGYVKPWKINTYSRDNFSGRMYMFKNLQIRLGTGSKLVEIGDWRLDNEIENTSNLLRAEALSYGPNSVSLPVITTSESVITISRLFTNYGPETVSVNEIGLICKSDSDEYVLLTRDLRSFDIAPGQTASINYEFVSTFTPAGGVTIQNNELLTRYFRGQEREAKDIFNENRLENDNHFDFFFEGDVGGRRFIINDDNDSDGVYGEYVGIAVGTGTAPFDQTDYKLDSQIPHTPIDTIVDGALNYGATFTDGFFIDSDTGRSGYYVRRGFFNPGATPVTVNEIGLISAGGNHTVKYDDEPIFSYLLYRRVLDNPIVIQPGEFKLISYKMEVVI